MPIYEFECRECAGVTSHLFRSDTRMKDVRCKACGSARVEKILSRIAVHRDLSSQLSGLDPKYDKMVDATVAKQPGSDPDRLLRKMKPFK